jgi:hypothetical protein
MKKMGILVVALLAGCATPPKKVDTTPKNKTVVLKAKGTINGSLLPDATFNQTVYTRADKRLISDDTKFDSWLVDKMIGGNNTIIFRMDKDLSWQLFDKKYIECRLAGCSADLLARFKETKKEDDDFEYDPADESQCKLTATTNKFTVTETGQTRKISGFDTKEYRAKWLVEYKDDKGRKDKNTLDLVFWNTVPTATMSETWKINEQATQAYRKAIKASNNPLSQFLSDELFNALSAFSGDTSKDNKKWNNSITRKLAKAKGYPISIKVDWYLDRKACKEAPVKAKKQTFDWNDPLASVKSQAKDYAENKVSKWFAPNPNESLFNYVYDVKSIAIEAKHDSVFEIPDGYKLVTRE